MTFTWRRTHPDSHHDFTAEEDGVHVGRIMRNETGPNSGTWFWTLTGCQRGAEAAEARPFNGEVATRAEAIEALSAAWRRAKAWSARTGMRLA